MCHNPRESDVASRPAGAAAPPESVLLLADGLHVAFTCWPEVDRHWGSAGDVSLGGLWHITQYSGRVTVVSLVNRLSERWGAVPRRKVVDLQKCNDRPTARWRFGLEQTVTLTEHWVHTRATTRERATSPAVPPGARRLPNPSTSRRERGGLLSEKLHGLGRRRAGGRLATSLSRGCGTSRSTLVQLRLLPVNRRRWLQLVAFLQVNHPPRGMMAEPIDRKVNHVVRLSTSDDLLVQRAGEHGPPPRCALHGTVVSLSARGPAWSRYNAIRLMPPARSRPIRRCSHPWLARCYYSQLVAWR